MRPSNGQESTSMYGGFNPFAAPLQNQQNVQRKPQQAKNAQPGKQKAGEGKVTSKPQPAISQVLLVLADDKASFFNFKVENSQSLLQEDLDFPKYPQAKVARFAPLSGKQAAIVDEFGIHFVDMEARQESLFVAQPFIETLSYSPADTFVVTCEKFNPHNPDYPNMKVFNTQSGTTVGQFVWRFPTRESMKHMIFSPDERVCCYRNPIVDKNPNKIDIFKNNDFSKPAITINATFQKKGATKNEPVTYVNGHFDDFQLCPLDPNLPEELSPRYLFAWQHAEQMTDEVSNGVVYVYDLNGQQTFEKSKFMIQCDKGQKIRIISAKDAYAVLVWSQSFSDTSGKSYYGQHSLQYVQIFGGKDRQFVPIFDNNIHDVAWTPNGMQFIVISGTQPATATLYDRDANPLFEFGKRFRNTIRVCPFSQLVMLGGFGSLDGEMDFWELSTMKNIGKAKSECGVGIEWAPNGLTLQTSVLYEQVRVDNSINIFNAAGKRHIKDFLFERLNFTQWQPKAPGKMKKPSLASIKQEAEQEEAKKPKKMLFVPGGGGNDSFAQLMRQQMGGSGTQGPRKIDAGTRQEYKQISSNQSAAFKDKIEAAQKKDPVNKSQGGAAKKDTSGFGNWRTGNFAEAKQSDNSGTTPRDVNGSGAPKPKKQKKNSTFDMPLMDDGIHQRQKTTCANAHMLMLDDDKKMSKHAKRRANKKAKQAAAAVAGEADQTGQQPPPAAQVNDAQPDQQQQ